MKRILSLVLAAVMVLGLLSGVSFAEVTEFHEAPELAEQVAAGTLPAVEDRLPVASDVFVETTAASGDELSIGTYTSLMTTATTGVSDWGISRLRMQSIVLYNDDGTRYANVIKSYESNEDMTEWTWHLREGLRWSDGELLTTEDIAYWYYMIHLTNFDTLRYWQGLHVEVDGEDVYAELEVIDDYTCVWKFAAPIYEDDFFAGDFKWAWAPAHFWIGNNLFPASWYQENPYFENPGTSDEEVLANALKLGLDFATVNDLGKGCGYYFWCRWQMPCLDPWVLKEGTAQSPKEDDLCVLVRNPYFWKVDAEGNQLPYINEIDYVKVGDSSQYILMYLSGEIDWYEAGVTDVVSVLSEAKEDTVVHQNTSTNWGSYQTTFNFTISDPNYNALFNNIDFRQAMSIAINRTDFSDLMWDGLLDPKQCSPIVTGWSEELDNHWVEYDPAKAIELLEGTGLVVKGADGYYDFADGSDLYIVFETNEATEDDEKAFAILKQYWAAIGINCDVHNNDLDTYKQLYNANHNNDNTAMAFFNVYDDLAGIGLISRIKLWDVSYGAADWQANWFKYFEDPETYAGTEYEPDDTIKEIVQLCKDWLATPTTAERDVIETKIHSLIVNGGYTIGMTECSPAYFLTTSALKNWFDNIHEDKYFYLGIAHPWVWWIAE